MLLTLDGRGPLYRQIYRALRAAVLDGTLEPGSRLPATRLLAETLSVSRNVVLAAYQHLTDEGYAEARIGAGTYVSPDLPESGLTVIPAVTDLPRNDPASPRLSTFGRRLKALGPSEDPDEGADGVRGPLPFDFRYGLALPDAGFALTWRRLLSRQARALPMDYASPQGNPALRSAIASHLRQSRGLSVEPSQIVITSGSQQALDLLTRLLAEDGETIVIEDPGYRGARQIFEAAGLDVSTCSVDGSGLQLDQLDRIARGRSPKWIYVTPSHQFPTGAVMPVERRMTLLDWANRHDAYIIEDDYDSELRYEGPPLEAVAALDRGRRVLYVGTFSKVLFPALRLGYVVLPPDLLDVFTHAKRLTDRHSSSLEQAALAELFTSGHFDRRLRRMRRKNSLRLQALRASLKEIFGDLARAAPSAAGIHLMVTFPKHTDAQIADWVRMAGKVGVGLYPLAPYYVGRPPEPGLLFGYANLTEEEIREGLQRLAKIVESRG